MTPFSEAWLDYVWAMLWQSSIVMVVVWVLYALSWKRSAAIRYALLCLILVKFLLPTSLHSVTGLGHWFGGVERYPTAQFLPVGASVTSPDFRHEEQGIASSSLVSQNPSSGAQSVRSPEARMHLPSLLFSMWLSGVLFLGSLLLVHAMRIRSRFSKAIQVDDPGTLNLLDECRDRTSVSRRIPLYQLDGLRSPVLAGLFRPRILVSPETLNRWDSAQLRPIFLHELAHAKRRDLLVNTLQIVLQVLWFFHPGLWFTNWLLRRERERACDDLVLANLEGAGKDYADSILKVLKESVPRPWATVGLLGIAERGAALRGRIRRILDTDRKLKVKIGVLGMISLFALGVVLLPMAKGGTNEGDDSDQLESVPGNKNEAEPGGESKSVQYYVRFVLGTHTMTFEGKPTSLEDLPMLLEKVPNRPNTVLEFATTERMTEKERKDHPAYNVAFSLCQQYDFKYFSNIGKHRIGSVGCIPKVLHAPPAHEDLNNPITILQYHVRIVYDGDKITFEGKETTLDDLLPLLEQVPNRPNTIMQFSTPERKPQEELRQDPRLIAIKAWCEHYKYKYFSWTGVHPMGTPGDVPELITRNPEVVADSKVDNYIVTFRAVGPFAATTGGELLADFNKNLPEGFRTHHYRSRKSLGTLIGHICLEGTQGGSAIIWFALADSKCLEVIEVIKAEEKDLDGLYALD